jgi:hypothetical protein
LFFLIPPCIQRGSSWSLLALAMFCVILRNHATPLAGAAAGALAGIAGLTVCAISCPILEASHILLGHVSLGLIFAAIGMFALPAAARVLCIRKRVKDA